MRILHTSDWHLGRLFHQVHLTEDQGYALEQVIACARDARPDVVVVAGDIYDRAVPPAEAVTLLNEVLSRLVLDVGLKTIMIAGNHDSPGRLDFGSTIMANQGLHIAARLPEEVQPVIIEDRYGPVHFYPVPYTEPVVVRERLGLDSITDHNSAMAAVVQRIRGSHPSRARSVLIAHAFVAGGLGSESERPLSVGGAGTVEVDSLEGFDYVALGHLHRPQQVGTPSIQYAGSLLKYAFSEADHEKGLKIVEMDEAGQCSVETVPIGPRHEVRRITGHLDDLLAHPETGASRNDFISVTLLDRGAVYDPIGKLRDIYPNVLEIKRPPVSAPERGAGHIDHRKMSDLDLFAGFYREVTGEALSSEQRKAFLGVLERVRQEEREA